VNIAFPPLRERREYIPALVAHFLDEEAMAVAPEAMDMLRRMEWPGNVRELAMTVANLKGVCRNRIVTRETVERITGAVSAAAAPREDEEFLTYRDFKKRVLEAAEREYFSSLLCAVEHNIAQAARTAGMHRKNLYGKLKQLGLRKE
jgi:DNA-binding NtrC family response regulator